jgi:hypothetical protein
MDVLAGIATLFPSKLRCWGVPRTIFGISMIAGMRRSVSFIVAPTMLR